jgi:hypothetical protein
VVSADLVAVLSPLPTESGGPGMTGSLSLVSQDGHQVQQFDGVFVSSATRPVFSTTGRYLAACASATTKADCGLAVLDTNTGKVSFLGQPATIFSWLPGDRLLASSGLGPVTQWSAGAITSTAVPTGSYGVASNNGEIAVWWPDNRPIVRLISPTTGIERDVSLSGDFVGILAWSPDSTHLALVTWLPNKSQGQLLSVISTGH